MKKVSGETNNKIYYITVVLVGVLFLALIFFFPKDEILAQSQMENGLYAKLETSKGSVVVRLYFERVPLTVMNFVGLAEGVLKTGESSSKPFYDGLTFHRVVPDFVIQGGDPRGNGAGGPGYSFPDEFHPELKHSSAGILSMANSGPDSNGSQFFITLKDTPWLDNRHSVFGKVVEGMEVVNRIEVGDKINSVEVVRKGTQAKNFKVSQSAFDDLIATVKKSRKDNRGQAMMDYIKKNLPNAIKDASGLYYQITKTGKGGTPQKGQQVSVHYKGTLVNGQVFDDSYQRGEPISFTYGQGAVIPGWEIALSTMKVGEERTVVIPPNLAYGEQGIGPIPPNSPLVFKMELVEIKK